MRAERGASLSVHVTPVRTYLLVFGTLMVLTAATVGVAHVNLFAHQARGWVNVWNDAAAMAIALTKAVVVVLFFMHVKGSTRVTKITIVASLLFLSILFAWSLSDYFTRGWIGVPGR